MLFWTEPEYLLAALVWVLALGVGLRQLLVWRRRCKARGLVIRKVSIALSVWMLLAFVTSLEIGFAAFADSTDAFNMTNISKRWFRRYIEPQRNEDGFRDCRPLQRKLAAGKKRVVFYGDSFTIGHGLRRMEDRFSDLVEVGLNAKSETAPWEVSNFGECGWEIATIEGMMKATFTEGYEANVIVYAYMLNDIEGYDPRTTEAIKEIQKHQPQHWLWTRTYFFNWLYFRWQQYQAGRTVDYFPHLRDSYRSPAWVSVQRTLQRMRDNARQNGADFRVAIFPFMHSLGSNYPFRGVHQQIADFCRDESIPVLDLDPVFSAHLDESLVVGRFDNHPNERAHRLAAEALLKDLLSDLRAD